MRLGVEAAIVDGRLVSGDVALEGGLVTEVGLAAGGRGIAAPGFVDLQVNGFAGVDFFGADAAAYAAAGEALLETGVTAYLPTFITSAEEDVIGALRPIPTRARGHAFSGRTSRARSSPRGGSGRIRRRFAGTRTARCSPACSKPGASGW